ncbi:hypothetical protein BVRB_1g019700 isoform B [Beta vulgaris subsp. vulgaris]|nr:hypothetical protein BVRB_1g019700 isoform B [Beta vulgaris subsp. vulgaris]
MDPEPGRCRRTDGKKWRCHQSVIPNEKYCGKHMHRGSKRSRKLVEASPNFRTPNFINLNRNNNLSSDIRPHFPANLNKNGPTTVVMRAPAMTDKTAMSNDNDKQKNVSKHEIVAKEKTVVINLASGLDFSPKSVLQNDPSMPCPKIENCKTNQETELRCKRTDGKKWRCKKEVLPDQKYCAQHINRGKVRLEKPSLGSSSTPEPQAKVSLGLDTNLKISLPTRPADGRNMIEDSVARNGSSCSSSEATESDESADFSDIIVLSP